MVLSVGIMDLEIEQQPQVLQGLLDEGGDAVREVARAIRGRRPRHVVIAARGTSDNAARYAKYVLGAHLGLPVGLAVPSLHTIYKQPPQLGDALVIGISQSGQSPDVVTVIDDARQQGGTTLAITNDPDSPLARSAEFCVELRAGTEHAVAATKTYTAQLMVVAMLSAALGTNGGQWSELANVPELVNEALRRSTQMGDVAAKHRGADRFLVLGRGFNYCTAFELALKIKETCLAMAEPYSIADLLHGPIAMLDSGFPAIVIAPPGPATQAFAPVLELLDKRGADTLVLSSDPNVASRASSWVSLPDGMSPWLSPLVSIVPGQRFAAALAEAKGHDPANPRGLSKVTLTL